LFNSVLEIDDVKRTGYLKLNKKQKWFNLSNSNMKSNLKRVLQKLQNPIKVRHFKDDLMKSNKNYYSLLVAVCRYCNGV